MTNNTDQAAIDHYCAMLDAVASERERLSDALVALRHEVGDTPETRAEVDLARWRVCATERELKRARERVYTEVST